MTIFNTYKSEAKGSYLTIPKLLQAGLKVFIFSGDWDDVVPFTDTIRNLLKTGLKMQGVPAPWKIKEQHFGFIRTYTYGLKFYQVKGAGHEVPLYQRERSLKVFEDFLYA
jgi:serine carboxypeptidase-like clade 2